MKRNLCLLLLPMFLASLPPLAAQEESPVIVDPPRVSKTVLPDWVLVEVRYTVRYLDGYELMEDMAQPQSMSFGVFELDPALGQKLIKENKRRYERLSPNNPQPVGENYFDLVYYLRHIGPKKGEIEIPEQVFHYIKLGPNQQREGQEVKELKVPGVKLNYPSVLTKDASDIKDVMDFGSFKKQERNWKIGAVAGFFASIAGVWFLIFRKPAVSRAERKKLKSDIGGQKPLAEEKIFLKPGVARRLLAKQLRRWIDDLVSGRAFKPAAVRRQLCDMLRRQFLPAYVPDILASDTTKEIKEKVSKIESPRIRRLLSAVSNHLERLEDALYAGNGDSVGSEVSLLALLLAVENLRSDRIFWFNLKLKFGLLRDASGGSR